MSKFKSNLEHNPLVKPLFFQICGDDAATKCESNGRPHVMLPSRPLLTREKPKLPPQQFGRCFICAADRPSEQSPPGSPVLVDATICKRISKWNCTSRWQHLTKTSLQSSSARLLLTKHFCCTTPTPYAPLCRTECQ